MMNDFLIWAVPALGVAMSYAALGLAIYLYRQSTLHEQVDICLPIEVVIIDPDEEQETNTGRLDLFAGNPNLNCNPETGMCFGGKPREL